MIYFNTQELENRVNNLPVLIICSSSFKNKKHYNLKDELANIYRSYNLYRPITYFINLPLTLP